MRDSQSSVYRIYISIAEVEGDERKGRHTLPTPVRPKNKNDAMGRLGDCSPAREIRTAWLIANSNTTWSCPTTLAARDSSTHTKASVNPRSIREKNNAHEPTYPSPPSTSSAPESLQPSPPSSKYRSTSPYHGASPTATPHPYSPGPPPPEAGVAAREW